MRIILFLLAASTLLAACSRPELPDQYVLPTCYRIETKWWPSLAAEPFHHIEAECEELVPLSPHECLLVYRREEFDGHPDGPHSRSVYVYDCGVANDVD